MPAKTRHGLTLYQIDKLRGARSAILNHAEEIIGALVEMKRRQAGAATANLTDVLDAISYLTTEPVRGKCGPSNPSR